MTIDRVRPVLAGILLAAAVAAASRPAVAAPLPYQDPTRPVAARVTDLLGRMTLAEKAGQMVLTERRLVDAAPALITNSGIGGLFSLGGSVPADNTPAGWAAMVDRYQSYARSGRLGIPLLYGIDAVHGNGYLPGATVFPHAVGLGATRDPALVRQVGEVTAAETRAAGPNWVFAPCLCVARDSRWGRAYESFGEDPALVTSMVPVIDGLQGPGGSRLGGAGVLATAKHFAGDGDTEFGSARYGGYLLDRGVAVTAWADFERTDLHPYEVAAHRGVGAVMVSYSAVDWTSDGVGNPVPMHASGKLITRMLKQRYGFAGIVVSDLDALDLLPGDWPTRVRTAVNAGIDMVLETVRWPEVITALVGEVTAGRIPQSRVDDAVSRVLAAKFRLGLFDRAAVDRAGLAAIGSVPHRAVARRAVAESQVLLSAQPGVLPLPVTGSIYVAGRNADDIGSQSGGWTVTWQGAAGPTYAGTTILAGLRSVAPGARIGYSRDGSAPMIGYDAAVLVVGEQPYAEGHGDTADLRLSTVDSGVVRRVCAVITRCVVLVVSGRPRLVDGPVGALVASWLPGSEGAGVADVLFGLTPFRGRLPVSWPRSTAQEPINAGDPGYDPLYPYGFGL